MRLAELQIQLARQMGAASRRSDEDPLVYMVDAYGRRFEIDRVTIDWQPQSLEEAEADTRHPVVTLIPKEATQ